MLADGLRHGRAALVIAASFAALLLFAPLATAAPGNDAFADASALPPVPPASVSGDNTEAGKEGGEPSHAGNAGGHSVWFSWTPAASGPVGIGTPCFGGLDALLAVYTGDAVNALTAVASNRGFPAPNCFGESAEVEFTASAGTTYWIAVDGRDGAQGPFSFNLNGSPENDNFTAATAVAGEPPPNLTGTTKFAGRQSGEPDHAGDPGGHSVWFAWTPTTSGPVAISTCAPYSSLDALLAVYTGSSLGGLTPIAANDDGPSPGMFPECRWTDSEVRFTVAAGTTYKIAVDGALGTTGRFNLRLRGRPANDAFADAQPLPSGLPTSAFLGTSSLFASKEAGEPDHAGDPGGHSVWFAWTPTTSGPVAINTCGSSEGNVDTLLAVYTGSDVGALTSVAANDDATSRRCGRGDDSEVQFTASAGTTYWIAVDGKGGAEGRFTLNLEGGGANDDFAAAQTLAAELPISTSGSTRLAGKQAGEPDHAGDPGGHSVWFKWTPTSSGPVVVSACPYTESVEPVLAVYTGSAVNSLVPVAADAGGGSSCSVTASEVDFDAVAGTTYRIAVDANAGGVGIFSLDLQGRPANDDFATPSVLPATPMTAGGSTRLATRQAGEPSHAGDPGGHSLWFSWTPSSSGPIDLTVCGRTRELDTLLAVYTGSDVGALTSVAANDDGPGPPANQLCEFSRGNSEVVFDAVAGTTYRIAVDGKGGSIGQFGIAFEPAPGNDDFAAAQTLSGALPAYATAVTKLATKEAGEPDHAGHPGGHSVWYSWTPATGGPATLSACVYYGDLKPLLAVYTGSALNALTPVAAGGDSTDGHCHGSEGHFTAVAGTTYRIAVDGGDASTGGGVQLRLEGAALNDDFGKADPLGGHLSASDFGTNLSATKQAGEPDHAGDLGGASVWFKWTAPIDAKVSVDTCGSSFDTLLGVYTGSAVGGLTPVASNDDGSGKCAPQSKLSFDAVANTVYRLAVDGKGGAQGSVELSVEARPRNDDFAAADEILGALGGYWPGSTLLATKEAGEPDHAGDPGGHSVWFSWIPKKSAAVEIDACAGSFEPLLAVYAGATVAGLSPVATGDAGSGQCEEGGRSVGFDAVAGTTYRLAVDGVGGDAGRFLLHLRPAIAHPRSLSVSSAGGGAVAVVSTPTALACASHCSFKFEVGEAVILKAEPASGSTFAGWLGGACAGTGTCQVTLNTDTAVVASFAAAPGGGGGEGAVVPALPTSLGPAPGLPSAPAKPLKCKRGFKKGRVHGKPKCVKKKAGRHRRKSR